MVAPNEPPPRWAVIGCVLLLFGLWLVPLILLFLGVIPATDWHR